MALLAVISGWLNPVVKLVSSPIHLLTTALENSTFNTGCTYIGLIQSNSLYLPVTHSTCLCWNVNACVGMLMYEYNEC